MAPTVEEWVARNAEWARDYQVPPTFKQMVDKTRADATVFLTCADPRVVPEAMFNMTWPIRAGVIRNAGGRAFDAVRSLETLHAIVNLANIIVIHHTDCGLVNHHNDHVHQELIKINPSASHTKYLENTDHGEILDIDASIREDVALLKTSPFLKNINIVGYRHDDATGALTAVA